MTSTSSTHSSKAATITVGTLQPGYISDKTSSSYQVTALSIGTALDMAGIKRRASDASIDPEDAHLEKKFKSSPPDEVSSVTTEMTFQTAIEVPQEVSASSEHDPAAIATTDSSHSDASQASVVHSATITAVSRKRRASEPIAASDDTRVYKKLKRSSSNSSLPLTDILVTASAQVTPAVQQASDAPTPTASAHFQSRTASVSSEDKPEWDSASLADDEDSDAGDSIAKERDEEVPALTGDSEKEEPVEAEVRDESEVSEDEAHSGHAVEEKEHAAEEEMKDERVAKGDIEDELTAEEEAEEAPKLSAGGKPLIETLFVPFEHDTLIPPNDPTWGIVPYPGEDGPKQHPDQPSARSSNAQTVPPLWEDRGMRYHVGRYVTLEDGTIIDQEDHMVLKLMNMRPIGRKNRAPKRVPVIYVYPNGKPKDWDNPQAIKAMNDRRRTAIERNAVEPPWDDMEREYLASLCEEFPDASIKEYAERLNHRFKGDFYTRTAFFEHSATLNRKLHDHHPGRTLESVVHEYRTYKDLYDQGIAPDPTREAGDKRGLKKEGSRKVKTDLELLLAKFGPRSGKARDEPEAKAARKAAKEVNKRKSKDIIEDSDDEADYDEPTPKHKRTAKGTKKSSQAPEKARQQQETSEEPKVDNLKEELLELAGHYSSSEAADSPIRYRSRSPSPESELVTGPHVGPSDTPTDKHSVGSSPVSSCDAQTEENELTLNSSQIEASADSLESEE